MVRPLDNQEHINTPEYANRVAGLKRRSETESREFALTMKEAVGDQEEDKGKKKQGSEAPLQDSVELSSSQETAEQESTKEMPSQESKHDAVDIVV
jgi:hypothetical protein